MKNCIGPEATAISNIGGTIVFSGLRSLMANRFGAVTLSTICGYSFAIQGFGFGYSKLKDAARLVADAEPSRVKFGSAGYKS